LPTVTVPANITECPGVIVPATNFTSLPAGATFTWTNSNPAIGLAASGVGNVPSFTTTNATGAAIVANITVTPTGPAPTNCVGPPSVYVISVKPNPPAPTVVTPVTYCQNAPSFALSAVGTNLLWYTVAIGGVGNALAPTPSTTVAGTTSYWVSQTVGGCESPRAQIDVVVNPTPAPPTVTSPVTYCLNDVAVPLTATGTALLWYTAAVGGVGSAAAPTPSTVAAGTTSYYVSQTLLGCEGPRAQIDVTVTALPPAPTVTTPVTYCLNAVAVPLTATGVNLLWYTVAVGGVGSAIAPTPSTAAAGTTSYWVSQTTGCEGPRAQIDVVVNPLPAAPTVTSPVTYCQNAAAIPLTATGTSLLWYTVAVGGAGNAAAPTPVTTTAGTTSYYVSQTLLGCEGPRAQIDVVVNPTPALPTVTSPVTYCVNAVAVPLTATGTALLWYTVPAGGAGSATAPTPVTTTAGSTNYYVSQTLLGCEGPRAVIVVTVNPLPVVTVTSPTICIGATATMTAGGATSYTWSAGATSTGVTTATASPIITTTYTVTGTALGCSNFAVSLVTVNALPVITVTSPTVCAGVTATMTASGGTSYTWSAGATPALVNTATATPAATSTYTVTGTALGCSNTAVSTVTVHPLPTAFISGYGSVCTGQPTPNITITFTGTAPWTFTYVHGGVPTTLTVGVSPYTISSPTAGTYTITALSDANCTGTFSGSGIIYVHPIPFANFTSAPNSGCVPLCVNFTDLSTISSGAVSHWNWDFGDGNTSISPSPSECYYLSGTYSVSLTVTSDSGCSNTFTMANLIHTYPVPSASFNCPFVTSLLDPRVQFNNTSLGATTYQWNFGDPNCPVAENQSNATSPIHMYSLTGTYCVQLIAANNNCYDTARMCLIIEPEFTFYVPNSFTPNGDGFNDEFFGKGENINSLEMWIYDRWGNSIFHGNGYNDHWDGTFHGHIVQEDVYVYVIKLKDFKNADHKYIGKVTVVR
jgi:gliding motility-associated-like protein